MMNKSYIRAFFALAAGTLFGAGLAASGMTNTEKVQGFLDVFGAWDIDLLFVMGAAVLTTLIGFRFILKKDKPVCCDTFTLPTSNVIDKPLIVGAILFGAGWGLYGFCPGPAIAGLIYLNIENIVFIAAMLIGMYGAHKLTAHP